MNYRALKQKQTRIRRGLFSLLGLCIASFIGYQAYAEDIWRPIRQNQTLAFQSTSSISATAFGTQTGAVRLVCSITCWISFGVSGQNPNASSSTGVMLPGGVPAFFGVPANGKIAVTSGSNSTGIISIVELSK